MNPRMRLQACLLLATVWLPPALAQSDEMSRMSAWSLAPSVAAASIVLETVPAGSGFVVQALRPVGDSVELVLVSAANGASMVLEVSAKVVRGLAIVAGATLVATTVSGGFVLSLGAEIVAFVPDALTRSLIHSREMQR